MTGEETCRVNEALDRHFKTNRGSWRVHDIDGRYAYIGNYGRSRLAPQWVALLILKERPDVEFVMCGQSAYTRTTLRRAGYRI